MVAIAASCLLSGFTQQTCFAQQNKWSPKPFVPRTTEPKSNPSDLPANRLRSAPGSLTDRNISATAGANANAQDPAMVARWRKVDHAKREKSDSRSYEQSLRLPQPENASSQPEIASVPSIQQASYHPTPGKTVEQNDSWYDRSSETDVTKAHRTEQRFDDVTPRHNVSPRHSGQTILLQQASAQDQTIPPADISEPPPVEPKRSLLEEELPRTSPFPESDKSSTKNPNRSPSDNTEPPFMRNRLDLDPIPMPTRSAVDCDRLRKFAIDADINRVRVDSSPSFAVGIENDGNDNSKDSFSKSSTARSWYSSSGELITEGRLVDQAFGSVIIERQDGERVSYLLRRLSDADQHYVSEAWGVPLTCWLGNEPFSRREFLNSTVTWKATAACHKPLYFEDVQLERYGHEWGPWVQPALSTAHFFGSVAVLPYKMGIHPINECQYSLGYYRPGSCAPWTVGPVPISLKGALYQATAVTGTALALP